MKAILLAEQRQGLVERDTLTLQPMMTELTVTVVLRIPYSNCFQLRGPLSQLMGDPDGK